MSRRQIRCQQSSPAEAEAVAATPLGPLDEIKTNQIDCHAAKPSCETADALWADKVLRRNRVLDIRRMVTIETIPEGDVTSVCDDATSSFVLATGDCSALIGPASKTSHGNPNLAMADGADRSPLSCGSPDVVTPLTDDEGETLSRDYSDDCPPSAVALHTPTSSASSLASLADSAVASAGKLIRTRRGRSRHRRRRKDRRECAADALFGAFAGGAVALCGVILLCGERLEWPSYRSCQRCASKNRWDGSAGKGGGYSGARFGSPDSISNMFDWNKVESPPADDGRVGVWRRLKETGALSRRDGNVIADLLLDSNVERVVSNETQRMQERERQKQWQRYRRNLQTQSMGPPPPSGPPLPALKGSKAKLVIAGKMMVEEGQCNVAQLDLGAGEWSLTERIQLSLYNSYSGGEVYMMLANNTSPPVVKDENDSGDSIDEEDLIWPRPRQRPSSHFGGELIVVGAFDTTYRNSQVTYCSVGKWDGDKMSKVGEGLCNSALSKGMKITCASLAGSQDVYVAGSFHTQVWNGDRHEFVKIFNVAHYNAVDQVWLPLPVGQITCSWCTVTVLALAWDSTRRQLHVAGKFNAIDGMNIPAGLAIYDHDSGRLVAHPGGGLSMKNITQDGVVTALQLDEKNGVLYVMGSFERLTATGELCEGIAAYEIEAYHWTCLADAAHSVLPTGGGNMLLTPFGLMVAGKTTTSTTWPDPERPYTIAVLKATPKKKEKTTTKTKDKTESSGFTNKTNATSPGEGKGPQHDFNWSWLPGFDGWMEPLHALTNGFGDFQNVVFIGGDNLVAQWYIEEVTEALTQSHSSGETKHSFGSRKTSSTTTTRMRAVTVSLSEGHVRGSIMAISQLNPPEAEPDVVPTRTNVVGYTIVVYCVTLGALFGMFLALMCNRNLTSTILSFIFERDAHMKGISLDTLTYSAVENTNVAEAYQRAMRTRFVQHPHLLTLIDPQEIILHRIIGEGTFGRVWSAKWRSSSVAVKEFVFAQAAVAGKSTMQNEIIEEIIGEAGMMAILRHPNVLQLFGCSLTAQAIWIVSELCSLGSLRQVLDDQERELPLELRVSLALQVAEGMVYLHTQDPPIIHRDLKSHNILCHETFTESDSDTKKPKKARKKRGSKDKGKADGSYSNGGTSGSGNGGGGGGGEKMASESTILAKIGDWGSARATLAGSRTMTHGVGTACWLAPEVIKHARSSKLSDVYGFGIILWEMATREEVYQGLESTQIIAKVANDNLRPPVPDGCPWTHIMVQCWKEDPQERLTFEEIVIELNLIKDSLSGGGGKRPEKGRTTAAYSSYQKVASSS